EFMLGSADSLEGADLASANRHIEAAEQQLRLAEAEGLVSGGRLAEFTFQRAGVAAQQGDLSAAIGLYREALAASRQSDEPRAVQFRILSLNNLAYHLHLLRPGDPEAQGYAEEGLRLAQEHGLLNPQTYLYSTLGEIALGQGKVAGAEQRFNE